MTTDLGRTRPSDPVQQRAGVADRLRFAALELRGQQLGELRFRSGPLGSPDLATATVMYEELQQTISADVAAGVTKHRPLSWWVRQVPKVVAVIDGVVLYTFTAEILNVPVEEPLASPVLALAAAFLAVLASGASYIWLALTGSRMRNFRDDLGDVLWRLLGRSTWLMIAVSLVLVGALSLLMYERIAADVAYSGQDAGLSGPLAFAFALVSAVANLSVVAVHALDGSMQSDLHRELGRLLRRRQRKVQRWQRKAIKAMGRQNERGDRSDRAGTADPPADPAP